MADSAKLRAQSMDSPDETRTFEKGKMEIVNVEEVTAGAGHLRAGMEVVGEHQADRGHRLLPGAAHRLRGLGPYARGHGRRRGAGDRAGRCLRDPSRPRRLDHGG
jgi:hypothetical protein